MWLGEDKRSRGLFPGRELFGPWVLSTLPLPTFAFYVYAINRKFGNVVPGALWEPIRKAWECVQWNALVSEGGVQEALFQLLDQTPRGIVTALPSVIASVPNDLWKTGEEFLSSLERTEANERDQSSWSEAATCLIVFSVFQLILMRVVPGPEFRGPMTSTGHVPKYTDNGLACFLITVAAFFLCAKEVPYGYDLFDGGIVVRNILPMIVIIGIASIPIMALIAWKGIHYPSTKDSGSNGSMIMDYYWGTELYPRILGWDFKTFTNCRFGMMGWAMVVISGAFYSASYNDGTPSNGSIVTTFLQLVYITKFFAWETGYFTSIDIFHDRAGWYVCGGCLYVVNGFYSGPSQYWANVSRMGNAAEIDLPIWLMVFYLVVGTASIFLNYEADRQRSFFRKHYPKKRVIMWGTEAKSVTAHYETADGKTHTSYLLTSHLWGPARHFQYVFEILAAFCWQAPSFHPESSVLLLSYPLFLVLLLTDRAVRDHHRCKAKYGDAYDEYCKRTPYLILPGVW